MMTSADIVPVDGSRQPIVFTRDGEAFTSSRDVAAYFDKRHADVMRAVDSLLAEEPKLALRNFAQGYYELQTTGAQRHRMYDMDRDGFVLLAMGFTGAKALQWKLRYIEAFNVMEAELRRATTDIAAVLADPARLRDILVDYADRAVALQGKIDALQPRSSALAVLERSSGSLCITDAAKALGVKPGDLFKFMRAHNWIYTRKSTKENVGFQPKITLGLLAHRTRPVRFEGRPEKLVADVVVTPRGLARLAQDLAPRLV